MKHTQSLGNNYHDDTDLNHMPVTPNRSSLVSVDPAATGWEGGLPSGRQGAGAPLGVASSRGASGHHPHPI